MKHLILALFLSFALAACGDNNQTKNDTNAAQRLLPTINGYTATDADSLVDAVTAAGAGASLTTGNLPLAAAIARGETVLQCLQDKGAAGGRTYVQTNPTDIVPQAGAVFIINQTRVNQNLLSCFLTTGAQAQGARAQAVSIEPCGEGGNFTFENNEYAYLYVGVGSEICGYFAQHFSNLKR